MGKHLVLVGGGHAHMVTLANLHQFIEKGHRVTVVGPSEYHYYSGMGPGMLGKHYTPEDIRFATRHVVEKQGGAFVLDKAKKVDPEARILHLESGETINYDVISFNAGSFVPRPIEADENVDVFTVKPIERLLEAQQRLLALFAERQITVTIIGGGPSSLEVAGNVWGLARRHGKFMPTIKIFAGSGFMARFPDKVRRLAERSLLRRGVEIIKGNYVKKIEADNIILENGDRHKTDFVFVAMGVKPSKIFADSGLPTGRDGGLLVNEYLQSVGHPNMFGGGDCIFFQPQKLDKVGVYAVRENPVLFHNLMASLEGQPLQAFDPGGDYLLIFNLGDGKGVLRKRWLTFDGKLAFMIKDYIDRKFMEKFQAIE